MTLFRGFSAFPITPSDSTGVVDETALSGILEKLAVTAVDSVGLLGSTGTYVYLSRAQRRRAVEIGVKVLSGSIPLMVGVGALRTDDAIALARDAETAGADAVLLAPVSYIPLTQEEVFQHFLSVSGATALPVCIYNNPTATHFIFSDDLLERLAQVPNICAVKMPSPEKAAVPAELDRLRPLVPDDFKIGYSWDRRSADAVAAGGDAWYSGIGGVLPEQALKLCRAAQSRDFAEVERINSVFEPLWDLCSSLGTVRVIYAVANLNGLYPGQPPLPISPLSIDERDRVMQAVSRLSAI
jgi:4-hydroxy-tetrahydrodipicolinate synthase